MKRIFLILMLFCALGAQAHPSDEQIEKNISSLLKKMTLEEKVGQLMQPYLSPEGQDSVINNISLGRVGSLLVTKNNKMSPEQRNAMQRRAVEETRLGIPLFFGYDVIHGFKTVMPISAALASSWDDELVERGAKVAAFEARHWGIDMAFTPMVDVARDPRWGRISECAGEDVLLNSRMGAATVRGLQGEDMSDPSSMASCVKHFVGDATCLGGRDKAFTEISRRALLETYLPPFKACVDAGSPSIMVTFNDIAGIPVAANHYAMTEVVKDQWGFDGIMLSDWDAVVELQSHGIVDSERGAAKAAFNAGMDVEMKSYCFDNLVDLVKGKEVSVKRLDDAVARVLRLKYRLGLFDNPYIDESKAYISQLTPASREVARHAASESMILLKNDGVLPLGDNVIGKQLSVVGPFANNTDLMGGWIGMGEMNDVVTPFNGIKNNAPKGVEVISGTDRTMKRPVSIVCVGEYAYEFGESHNRTTVELSPSQVALVKEVKEYSSKVIVVVCSGRPLALTPIMGYADAIVQGWHGGTETGNGLADVIFGKVNPSGKTTNSYVKETGQIPIFYSDRNSGRPNVNRYTNIDAKPLFPFGYGLSYTTFDYSNFRLSSPSMPLSNGKITATVTVTNSGKVDGKEVVQLYIRDKVASVTVPKRRLIDYKKVFISAGESVEVSFEVTPSQLTLVDANFDIVTEKGDFDIWVGKNSEDLLSNEFTVK